MRPSWIRRILEEIPFVSNGSGSIIDAEPATSDQSRNGNLTPGQGEFCDVDDPAFGMHVFVDKHANQSGVVDFVALHGLNGHYRKTWTATSADNGTQVNWLKDLLPAVIPNARVMSFGYNSVVQFSKGTAGIADFAEQLLEGLMARRTSPAEKRRPVIFICHSLGGIVFKQVGLTDR
jgi:predicted alpha/beta-fold hydrolase